MLNKSELMKKWKDMSDKDKQMVAIMAGAGAGLFLKGLVRMTQSKKFEVMNIVVPKDVEVMIIVKGGK